MKHPTLFKPLAAALCGLLLVLAGMIGVFAEDIPVVPEEIVTEYVEPTDPVYTDPPTEPVTDPPTEPVTDPPTEPVTDPPTAATTQAVATTQAERTEETTAYSGYVEPPQPQGTDFVPPTIPKTVSQSSYTTNYAFGIVSWICVLVGLIVIFAVAVSTKVSGFRANRRV